MLFIRNQSCEKLYIKLPYPKFFLLEVSFRCDMHFVLQFSWKLADLLYFSQLHVAHAYDQAGKKYVDSNKFVWRTG